MNGFFEYLEEKGVNDIRKLTGFVDRFLQDPSIFYDLTDAQRTAMEKKIDATLAFFKNEKD